MAKRGLCYMPSMINCHCSLIMKKGEYVSLYTFLIFFTEGTLHDPTHGRTNQLKAKIHLEGSWWIVRLLRTKKDDGFIVPMDDKATSYELIRDEGLAKRYRLVYMLLSDRKQDNSVALNKFEEFVR